MAHVNPHVRGVGAPQPAQAEELPVKVSLEHLNFFQVADILLWRQKNTWDFLSLEILMINHHLEPLSRKIFICNIFLKLFHPIIILLSLFIIVSYHRI